MRTSNKKQVVTNNIDFSLEHVACDRFRGEKEAK
jgi:hypothetical protein